MKLKIGVLFVILGILSFKTSCAMLQQPNTTKVDSLEQLILITPNDTSKVLLYADLARLYLRGDKTKEMIKTADVGFRLAKKLDYTAGMGQMLLTKGLAYYITGESDEALTVYDEGLSLIKGQGEKALESKFYINIGACYQYRGDINMALENYLKAYNLREAMKKDHLGRLLNNIGAIYRFKKKYNRAEEIYLESYGLKKEVNDSLGIAASLMNLGLVYSLMEEKKPHAVKQLQESREIYQKLGRLNDAASCDAVLGKVYTRLNDIPKAKVALYRAWAFYETEPISDYSCITLVHLGGIALGENQLKDANTYYTKALEAANKLNRIQDQVEILFGLSELKNKLGNTSGAYKDLKIAVGLTDSLNETSRIEAMEEMQTKFDVSQKDNQLLISSLTLDKRTRQRNFVLIGGISLLFFTLSLILMLRSKLRANKKITLQQQEIQSGKITELQQENKLLALNSMIEGQETERMRIAQDLHDSLGGLLSTVKAHFETIQGKIKQLDELNITKKTNELIDEACVEVRRISHNMVPHALTLSGLPLVLEDLVENMRNEGFNVDLEVQNFPENLTKTQQATLYRLVQEVISNIRKHAETKNVLIQMLGNSNGLSLIIEDDGIGFDYEKALATNGIGIESINSRVMYLDGTVDWDTQSGKGTTLTIYIPLS